jgi:hypothetical protein
MQPLGKRRAINDIEGGKKFIRQFEHVEGNWPSSVFLTLSEEVSVPSDYVSNIIGHFIGAYNMQLPSYILDNLVTMPIDKMHVSLSKPFTLRHHQIDYFINGLKNEVCVLYPLKYSVKPEYYILLNETKTRLFLCLPIDDQLQNNFPTLIQAIDSTLIKYKKEKYYTNPIFHISVASAVIHDVRDVDKLINLDKYNRVDSNKELFIDLNKLQCRIGDRCYVMDIKDNLTIWPKEWELL